MRYAHILLAFAGEIWAMEEAKLSAIVQFLTAQAAGEKFSAEEIEARIGREPGTPAPAPRVTSPTVALLPIRGVMANRIPDDVSGGNSFSHEGFSRAFQGALNDDRVGAIVLDVDSPGGAVSGADELSTMIFEARGRKPIVAHVNANMASCAYWVGSGADEIVTTSSGELGAIGVFGVHDDVSAALDKLGVKKTLIKAGKYKAEGHPFEPLGEEARAHIQARVDDAYDTFVETVARNRGVAASAVRNGFGQGRMVSAQAAIAEKMADGVGTLESVLQRFGVSLYPQPAANERVGRRAFALARELRALDL